MRDIQFGQIVDAFDTPNGRWVTIWNLKAKTSEGMNDIVPPLSVLDLVAYDKSAHGLFDLRRIERRDLPHDLQPIS